MKILVLGGTSFLGRHFVEAAAAHGHELTLFNRGRTNPGLFADLEHLHGERDGGLDVLVGRRWDAVLDTSGFVPRVVRASAELLAPSADHYTFISSVSAYADLSTSPDESSPVGVLEDPTVEDMGEQFENYGPLKALCERAALDAFPGRSLVVRPGLIVGPHDPTDRFTYWARRLAGGGPILAPGPPERRTQFIDVRDLAAWLVRAVEERRTGVYNATNDGTTFGELLRGADVVWVDDAFLVSQGVGEWIELPLWIADPAFAAMDRVDVSKALAAGLTFRPVADTVRDTADWDASRGDYEPRAGLAPERERELLEAWSA